MARSEVADVVPDRGGQPLPLATTQVFCSRFAAPVQVRHAHAWYASRVQRIPGQAVAVRRHYRFASCGSCIHLLENPMPISRVGEIAYQPASPTGGTRLQANPPVCNRCWHEITPQNFGRASVVGQAPSPGRFEFIECIACTTVRARDPERTRFWVQHQR